MRQGTRAFFEHSKIDAVSAVALDKIEAVSAAVLYSLCGDKSRKFLQFLRLISKFSSLSNLRGVYCAANVKQLMCFYSELKKCVSRASFLGGSMLDDSPHQVQYHKYPKSLILIWNTGAYFGISPFRSGFIDRVK